MSSLEKSVFNVRWVVFHLMVVHYTFSSVLAAKWPPFR